MENTGDVLAELRQLITSIKGVKSFDETLKIEYVLVVENEEDRQNVEKVMNTLSAQGEKFKIAIEAVICTEDELQKAKDLYSEHLTKETKFKA